MVAVERYRRDEERRRRQFVEHRIGVWMLVWVDDERAVSLFAEDAPRKQ